MYGHHILLKAEVILLFFPFYTLVGNCKRTKNKCICYCSIIWLFPGSYIKHRHGQQCTFSVDCFLLTYFNWVIPYVLFGNWEVITYPCHKSMVYYILPLKNGRGYLTTSQSIVWMLLLLHILISQRCSICKFDQCNRIYIYFFLFAATEHG